MWAPSQRRSGPQSWNLCPFSPRVRPRDFPNFSWSIGFIDPLLFSTKLGFVVRTDSLCPRCGQDAAHLLHMVWECSALDKYGRDVLDPIHTVYGIRLLSDPTVCILGLVEMNDASLPSSLGILHMLFQARKRIAFHWLRPSPPTLREYVTRMNHIIRLEKGCI